MQISRLFEIVYILLNRRHVTARELAEKFEVSVRTVYRDIDALGQAGVPVYTTQGAGGGIHISDAYVLSKSALTDAEQDQILLALQSMSVPGNTESEQLLSRLGNLFKKDGVDWIEVDFSRWGNAQRDRQALALIKEAVLHTRPLSFTYYSGYGVKSQRTVCPIKLVYKASAWYVRAYCLEKEDYRTFKVVRMQALCLGETPFDRKCLPCLPPLEAEPVAEPQPAPLQPATLRFHPQIAWRVLDEFDPAQIRMEEDGSLVVETSFPCDEWLLGYILSFGTQVEVLAPQSFRRSFRQMLEEMLGRYSG